MPTTDPLLEVLTRVLELHNFADADTCACGVEYDGAMTYDRHQAEVYLAAVQASGRLLPDGTTSRLRYGYRTPGTEHVALSGIYTVPSDLPKLHAYAAAHGLEAVTSTTYDTPWEVAP